MKKLATRSTIFVMADMLQAGLAFFLLPLYTAYFTPADYGIVAIAVTANNILTILYLQSLEGAFNRFYYDMQDVQERRAFYGSVWLFLCIFTLCFSLLLEGIGRSTNSLGFQSVPYSPYLQMVVWTVFVYNTAFLLPRSIFLVREEAWKYAALNIALFVLPTILIIYLIVFQGAGVLGYVQGRLYGTVIVAIPALWVIRRNISIVWRFEYIKAALFFAVPLLPHLLSLWILDLSDRFILERYVSLSDIGIYTLGYQLASVLQMIAFSVSTAIGPFYFKTATDDPDAQRTLSRLATYYLVFLAWMAVGMVALGRHAVTLLASRPEYYIAYQVIPWVVLGYFARGYYFIFVMAIYYAKQVKALPFITMGAALINIAINLLLIPYIGYFAAAISTFVAYAVQSVVMYFFARRAYALPYEYGRWLMLTLLGVIWGIALYTFALPGFWMDLVLKFGLALLFPVGLFCVGFFRKDEIAMLYQLRRYLPASRNSPLY